jgi:hypothetical protein
MSVIGFMPWPLFSRDQSPLPIERVAKYLMNVFTFLTQNWSWPVVLNGDG